MSSTTDSDRIKRTHRTAMIAATVVFAMTGAAFAAVPLYKTFCQATGFDGTVRKAQAAPTTVIRDRT